MGNCVFQPINNIQKIHNLKSLCVSVYGLSVSSFTTVPVCTPPLHAARPSLHTEPDLQGDNTDTVRTHTQRDVLQTPFCKRIGSSPLRMSSKPMQSSLPRRVSRPRFELGKNGSRWIWKVQGERSWVTDGEKELKNEVTIK